MGRETTFLYSTLWSFWQPPYAAPLRDFQDTLLFWKTTRSLGALAAAAVPKAPAASNGHNFVGWAPNILSDQSIGIYCLCRCRWTPHVLHLSKYSLSYAPPKSRDSRASLFVVCCPSPQHSQSWAMFLGSAHSKYHNFLPTPLIEVFLGILESQCHEPSNAQGLTLVTPSLHGWEAFPTPRGPHPN